MRDGEEEPQFFWNTLEKLMKCWTERSYIYMKSSPRVLGLIPFTDIGYKYSYRKVLGFIASEGDGSTDPGDPYLYLFPDTHFIVSVLPIICPHLIGIYFNDCIAIDNHNRI